MPLCSLLSIAILLVALQPTESAGKVVMVTGASSGIGLVASKYFARKGLRVVLTARRTSLLEDAVKEITAAGGTAIACKLDVTKEEDHEAAFGFAEKTYGGVDYVFANAGYIGLLEKPFESQTTEEIMKPWMINVQGTAFSVKYAVTSMRKNNPPGGSIVLCSSSGSILNANSFRREGATSVLPYTMAKSAIESLTRGLAAYEKEGIRGYSVSPFLYESEMSTRDLSDKFGVPVDAMAGRNPIFNNIQTPWIGYPEGTEKVGHVVLAMFDGTTKYKTGDVVLCDGDATWNVQVGYNEVTSQDSPIQFPSREVFLASMNDYKGDPYDISQLPKMPEKKAEL